MSGEDKPHVVIIGAGFAGLNAARSLRKAAVRITIVDQRNHHLFQPLLYQVATAALSPGYIAKPIRGILRRQKNATVILAEARAIEPDRRRVLLSDGAIEYDFLIVATGATHSYFGNDHWSRHAPGLKTIEDALEIRRRVLLAYEQAERQDEAEARHPWLTFVVVGAGPTGVEMAGALAEISRHALARDFRRIDPTQARVLLLEGGGRVLPAFPEELSAKAQRQLEKLGVEVRTGALVTEIDDEGVSIGEERIDARTVVWGAGVAASPLAATLGAPLDRAGRVRVEADLTIAGHREVFVVGDLALLEQDGKPIPGIAPAAIQEGRHVARSILRGIRGQDPEPFRYRDKGMLATIGRNAAVADLGKRRFSGWFAWMTWLLVHIFFLIGFRNRFLVLFEWAVAYFSRRRETRLITDRWRAPPRDQG